MNAPLLRRPIAVRTTDLANALDRARIDTYVHEHAESTPFHLPAWSVAVTRGCRQKSHYLVAEHAGGQTVGVLPLTEVRSPLFGAALVSAGFGVGGGVLADSDEAATALTNTAWALAQKLGCPTLELRGGPNPGPEWAEDDTTYIDFERALAADDEAELKAIPKRQRAEIRRSYTFDLHLAAGGLELAAAHHRVYAESVRNLGTPVFPARLFRETLAEFGDSADILVVSSQGLPVASVLTLYWKGTAYPYWGGGTHGARAVRANDRLYFELMRHARARGCTRFSFGRSKVGTGAAAFKKNWGFEAKPLRYFTRTPDGVAPRKINPLSPKYRLQVDLWKRLPLWLANRAGPLISRGLG